MIDLNKLGVLRYWIQERELIRKAKERNAPKPWTKDRILQSFRFCNVRREDDVVTRWFASNWRHERYWKEPNFVPAIILGRTINWPPALEHIGFPHEWSRDKYLAMLDDFRDLGKKVYTGAYMITAGPPGVTKNQWVTGNADTYFANPPRIRPTLEATWQELQNYPCVGPFIAGQIIADLKQTDILNKAPDWWGWAPVGPGSNRGLNRLYSRPLKFQTPQAQGVKEMVEVRRLLELDVDLCLHDIQNCLCEFDKYMRVLHLEGRPRSSYPGT